MLHKNLITLTLTLCMLATAPGSHASGMYTFEQGHDSDLEQFSGKYWWDILSFCTGAMMAIHTEQEARQEIRDEAFKQITFILMPLLNQTGENIEHLENRSAGYAQGLYESGMFRDESRQAGVMQVCLQKIPARFRQDIQNIAPSP